MRLLRTLAYTTAASLLLGTCVVVAGTDPAPTRADSNGRRATLSAVFREATSGALRLRARSDAKLVRIAYRRKHGGKATTGFTLRNGTGAKRLPKRATKIRARAMGTDGLRPSAWLHLRKKGKVYRIRPDRRGGKGGPQAPSRAIPPATPGSGTRPSTSPAPAPTSSPSLDLPRIPWEGGPGYWQQFPNADRAGWSDPTFFPIVAWWGGFADDSEVAFDTSMGINTYTQLWPATPFRLFEDNGVFWIGDKLNESFQEDSPNWVGRFLIDEIDGIAANPVDGRAQLQALIEQYGPDGRFKYNNYTSMVVGTDMAAPDAEAYVNDYTDVVSVDMYFYTIPFCDWDPFRDFYLAPVQEQNCRTASSYGKTMESLRLRDQADGKLQPLWQFVENLSGSPAEGPVQYIGPAQLKGAVMNSIINEARGIAYFNQVMHGPCSTGNVLRAFQNNSNYCNAAPVAAAMKDVNSRIHALAPVINTQSYQYSFGPGLDTMLKTKGGYAYVFAMIDGASQPGQRTLHLPAGVSGRQVTIQFENRTLTADGDGRFTDAFAAENTYHIYKVRL